MSARARILLAGAGGYTGGELIRLLLSHPGVELLDPVASPGSPERPLGEVHPGLRGLSDLRIRSGDDAAVLAAAAEADAALLATPDEASAHLVPLLLEQGVRVVDLSGAFRLPDPSDFRKYYGYEHPAPRLLAEAVYSIPEIASEMALARLRETRLVANPGCYPTCISIALAPFLALGLAEPGATIVCDAKSGTSGAGRKARTEQLFSEMDANLRPYGLPRHRHTPEIRRALGLAPGSRLVFAPHVFGAHRGMLATCYVPLARPFSTPEAVATLDRAWVGAPLVRVLPEGSLPDVRGAAGTPFADVGAVVSEDGGTLVAVCAIDNLLKGAASQAVQNLNRMLGFPETLGTGARPAEAAEGAPAPGAAGGLS